MVGACAREQELPGCRFVVGLGGGGSGGCVGGGEKLESGKREVMRDGGKTCSTLHQQSNLSAEFEDFFDDSINKVNAAELEDITYSDDEDDVGAEDDFNNLETSITVNPMPTTRVHKDHPVTQIIGDLSSATQTRSMARVAKD
nr:hypothetical protein [Tanacetum cinerariifolium]